MISIRWVNIGITPAWAGGGDGDSRHRAGRVELVDGGADAVALADVAGYQCRAGVDAAPFEERPLRGADPRADDQESSPAEMLPAASPPGYVEMFDHYGEREAAGMNKVLRLTTSTLCFLAASTAFAWPTAAQAAVPTTGTIQTHGSWVAPEDHNPCTGHTVAVTNTGHMVEHFTYFTASDFRLAISETGLSSFTDDGISYTGQFQLHVDFIDTTATAIQDVSLLLRLQGTDGSVVVGHEVIHLRWSGDPTTTAPVQSFDRPNFTCG